MTPIFSRLLACWWLSVIPLPAADKLPFPPAEKKPVIESYFGVDLVDDYSWMDNADAPVMNAYAAAQNERTQHYLAKFPASDNPLPDLTGTPIETTVTAKDGTLIPLSILILQENQKPVPIRLSTAGHFSSEDSRQTGIGQAVAALPKRETLQDSLDDLIACIRYLIDQKITTPDQFALTIDNGLLAATAVAAYPSLFRAVVIPPARFDALQNAFDNISDRAQFNAAIANSPYRRIQNGLRYPAILFLDSPTSDTRSQSLKMTARLQGATASDRPILFLEINPENKAEIARFLEQELK